MSTPIRVARLQRALASICALLFLAATPAALSAKDAPDLTTVDLTGAWYVLVHYKDDRSEDPTVEKFKDFAWIIEQTDKGMSVESHPYVVFDEGSEELRRFAMRAHKTWQPEGLVLSTLRDRVDVSSRAMKSKKLEGSVAEGFASPESLSSGGAMTMSFTQNWSVDFSPGKIRILIVDSLSGGSDMLGEMEEAILYEVTGRTPDGDLTGTYKEGHKAGTFRMIRAKERRVVK